MFLNHLRAHAARDPFRLKLLLWSLLFILPLGIRLTGSWLADLLLLLLLAALSVLLFGWSVPAAEKPRRRWRLLFGRAEWLLLALFAAAQLAFLFDGLPQGRDHQPDLMAAAVNAMRLGAAARPSPLAAVVVLALALLAGALCWRRWRFRWHLTLWLLLVGGVTVLAHRLPLATTTEPSPVLLQTCWLTLCGISEPASRTLQLLVFAATGMVWHQLLWRLTGIRTGALLGLALVLFNPASFHYAHVSVQSGCLLLVGGLLLSTLWRVQDRRPAAPALWLALLLAAAWSPALLPAVVLLLVAALRDDEALSRVERLRLWGGVLAAATLVYAVRAAGSVSGLDRLLPDPALLQQPARLVVTWLALPALLSYVLCALAVLAAIAVVAGLPRAAGMVIIIAAAAAGLLLHGGGPALLLAIGCGLLLVAAGLLLVFLPDGAPERQACALLLGTVGFLPLTAAATRPDWWLAGTAGVVLLVARLLALSARLRLPAWLPALLLALPLCLHGLLASGTEFLTLRTRAHYLLPWPQAAAALAAMPPGTGIYCPPDDVPLPFYLAQQRVFDRVRLRQGAWMTPDYQSVDALFEYCVATRCRFVVLPRGLRVQGSEPLARRTALVRLREDYPALPDLAYPSALAGLPLKPVLAEELLAGRDVRFALRRAWPQDGYALLLIEAGTLELAR